jgi:hypothetical protein
MADYFIGIEVGAGADTVVVDTSTNSTKIELRADTAAVTNREALLVALENLKVAITKNTFPPV